MATALYTHAECLRHVTPAGHPERAERLQVILPALTRPEFDALVWREAPQAARRELLRVHPEAYVAAIEAAIPAVATKLAASKPVAVEKPEQAVAAPVAPAPATPEEAPAPEETPAAN